MNDQQSVTLEKKLQQHDKGKSAEVIFQRSVVSDEVRVVAVELVFSGLPIAFFLAADTAVGDADDAARLGAPKNDVKEACVDPVLRRLGEREEDMIK